MNVIVNTREARGNQLDKDIADLEKEYIESTQGKSDEPNDLPVNSKEEETWKTRHGELRSWSQKRENQLKKELEDLRAEKQNLESQVSSLVNKPDSIEFPKNATVAEVKEWVTMYPDIAGVIRTMMLEEFKDVRAENEKIKVEHEKEKANLARQRAFQDILDVHSDARDLLNESSDAGSKFSEWLYTQREEGGPTGEAIWKSIYENDTYNSKAAIKTINIYKRELDAEAPKRRTPSREAMEAPIPNRQPSAPDAHGGKRQFLESDIDKMHIREYERLEKDIEDARRDNRIVYDITGAKR